MSRLTPLWCFYWVWLALTVLVVDSTALAYGLRPVSAMQVTVMLVVASHYGGFAIGGLRIRRQR